MQCVPIAFKYTIVSLMQSVSEPVCCMLAIAHVQTQNMDFFQRVQMKESNHHKTHKGDVSPLGHTEKVDLCNVPVIQTSCVHVY